MNPMPDPDPATGRRLVMLAQWFAARGNALDEVSEIPAYCLGLSATFDRIWLRIEAIAKIGDDLYHVQLDGGEFNCGGDAILYVDAEHYDTILGRVDVRHLQSMPDLDAK